MIGHINNSEIGLSVRNKLNQVIDFVDAYNASPPTLSDVTSNGNNTSNTIQFIGSTDSLIKVDITPNDLGGGNITIYDSLENDVVIIGDDVFKVLDSSRAHKLIEVNRNSNFVNIIGRFYAQTLLGAEVFSDGNTAYISADAQSNTNIESNLTNNDFFHATKNLFRSPINEFSVGGVYFASGIGIDTTSTVGSDVLNIGATNANVINYGNSSTVHNFLGTAIYELQVNSYVEDKLITLNYGGAVGSGIGVGFEIEEDAIIMGYFKTNAARDAFSIKAPGHAFESEFSLSALTSDRIHYLPNGSGILALESFVDSKVADAINNGITTVAPSQNAVFDALALKLDSIDGAHIKSPFYTTTIIDHAPNTIAASAIYSQLIPAGTLKGGDILRVQFKLLRLTGTGSAFTRIYHGLTLNSLTNRIAQYSSTTAGATTTVTRNYRIAPDGLSMSYISGAIAFTSDETVTTNTANEASLGINVNADFYLTIGVEMSVATDVYRLHYVYSQIIRN